MQPLKHEPTNGKLWAYECSVRPPADRPKRLCRRMILDRIKVQGSGRKDIAKGVPSIIRYWNRHRANVKNKATARRGPIFSARMIVTGQLCSVHVASSVTQAENSRLYLDAFHCDISSIYILSSRVVNGDVVKWAIR